MEGLNGIVLILILASVTSWIYFYSHAVKLTAKISRPLTTGLILLSALTGDPFSGSFATLLLIALLVATISDILAELPPVFQRIETSGRMLTGMLLLAACIHDPGPYIQWGVILPVSLLTLFSLWKISRQTAGRLRNAVYVLIFAMLITQAAGRAWYLAVDGILMMLGGVLLYVVSELLKMTAWHRSKRPTFTILRTAVYWSGLLLIAVAVNS
jgi:hypothetical protein